MVVYLCESDGRGSTRTHDDAVVLGKRHLILRTNDNNHTRCIARLFDVFVLIDINRHCQTYTGYIRLCRLNGFICLWLRSVVELQHNL